MFYYQLLILYFAFSALTLLVECEEERSACRNCDEVHGYLSAVHHM